MLIDLGRRTVSGLERCASDVIQGSVRNMLPSTFDLFDTSLIRRGYLTHPVRQELSLSRVTR